MPEDKSYIGRKEWLDEKSLAKTIDNMDKIVTERDRLKELVFEANNLLFDVHADDEEVEHMIECHKEDLEDTYRRFAKIVSAVHNLLAEEVSDYLNL